MIHLRSGENVNDTHPELRGPGSNAKIFTSMELYDTWVKFKGLYLRKQGPLFLIRNDTFRQISQNIIRLLRSFDEKGVKHVFFLPYANYYSTTTPGQNYPVLLLPYYDQSGSSPEKFMFLDDVAEAIYYYYWLQTVFYQGSFVDQIPLVGMMILECDDDIRQSLTRDPDSLRLQIPRKMIEAKLDKSLCGMLERAHKDNVLQPQPRSLEAMIPLFVQGRTEHLTSSQPSN